MNATRNKLLTNATKIRYIRTTYFARDTCRWGILPITWVTSPGVGFALVGTICNPRYMCFSSWQSNERLNRHIGFNVIFAAVYYDVLLVFHDVNKLLVYM